MKKYYQVVDTTIRYYYKEKSQFVPIVTLRDTIEITNGVQHEPTVDIHWNERVKSMYAKTTTDIDMIVQTMDVITGSIKVSSETVIGYIQSTFHPDVVDISKIEYGTLTESEYRQLSYEKPPRF